MLVYFAYGIRLIKACYSEKNVLFNEKVYGSNVIFSFGKENSFILTIVISRFRFMFLRAYILIDICVIFRQVYFYINPCQANIKPLDRLHSYYFQLHILEGK